MMSVEPLIKIIPPNPFTTSIIIVYCYVNNKTIQCQAKWVRIQVPMIQNYQNRYSRSMMNVQIGNTYKCSPLDFNHTIQVQAVCEYLGRQYKLSARTDFVKGSKQILQRKNYQKWVLCKISNSNLLIQCRIGLQMSKVLQLNCGSSQFNLQLNSSHIIIHSINAFKASIHTHRYQFLSFFHDNCNNKQKNNNQQSLPSLFEFIFHSQIDRDLTLFKIAEISTIHFQKNIDYKTQNIFLVGNQNVGNFIGSTTNQNINQIKLQIKNQQINQSGEQHNKNVKTKRSLNQFKKGQTHRQNSKLIYNFKTPDAKSANFSYEDNDISNSINTNVKIENREISKNNSGRKKTEKIKITQKLVKRMQTQNNYNLNDSKYNKNSSYNQFKIKEENVIMFSQNTALNSQTNEVTPKNKNKNQAEQSKYKSNNNQFLNIFDDDEALSEPEVLVQNSSQFYKQLQLKQRPVTAYIQNKQNEKKNSTKIKETEKRIEDIPSINLRGSFQQLQKTATNEIGSKKKTKQKIKTQSIKQLSYQYPKSRQKTDVHQEHMGQKQIQNQSVLKNQIQELKQQNRQLKKQLEIMHGVMKQNHSLKKKYYQLNEEVNRLELERKQILADKLKCQSNYHKQKLEKDKLKIQLQELLKQIEESSLVQFKNSSNQQNNSLNQEKNHFNQEKNYLNQEKNSLTQFNLQKMPNNQQSNLVYNNKQKSHNFGGYVKEGESYEQNRKKIYTQLMSPSQNKDGKKSFLNEIKDKNLANKTLSNNHSFIDHGEKTIQSNTQSRKQLRFPSYSYKYNTSNSSNHQK